MRSTTPATPLRARLPKPGTIRGSSRPADGQNSRMKLSSSRGALHVELKLGELSRTIELAKAGNAVEALGVIKSNKGRDLMRDIRTALDEFDGDETNIENARNTKAALLRSVLLLVTVIAGVLAATVSSLLASLCGDRSANCGC